MGLCRGDAGSRVRRVDVTIPRLGAGLDGVTVVLLTDTHYGPIDRARWSIRVVDAVNVLDADIVCHTGDIADVTVERRRAQGGPVRRGSSQAGSRVRDRQPSSTSARRKAGSTVCASSAGRRCTTATLWWSAADPGWSSPTWLRRLHSEPCRVQRHLAIIGTFEQVSVMSLVIEKGRVAEPRRLSSLRCMPRRY